MPSDRLAEALVAAAGNLRVQKGLVTATSPLTVTLSGIDSVATSRLDSYTPGAGDVVLVLVTGSAIVVLGELVAA